MSQNHWHLDTLSIHAGQEVDAFSKSEQYRFIRPRYVFMIQNTQENFFTRRTRNIYTRIMNPTQRFEERIAALELVSVPSHISGQARSLSLLKIVGNGDEISIFKSLWWYLQLI